MATYIHIGPESRQLLDRLNQVVEAYKSKTAQPFQEQFHEFELAAAFRQQLYNAQSLSLIQDAFKGVAELAQPPLKGYQVTLNISLRTLAASSPQLREFYLKSLASIRLTVTGAPLRPFFAHLREGTSTGGPAHAISSRPGQVYWIKPNPESVTIVLPICFLAQDAAIGHAILQEFVEARRSPVCGKAPSCTYHPARTPPLELHGVDTSFIKQGTSGYMCFTFFRFHVQSPEHTEHILWSMTTFYTLLGYHIKACKAMMHGRMRTKINQWLHSLDLEGCSQGVVVTQQSLHASLSMGLPRAQSPSLGRAEGNRQASLMTSPLRGKSSPLRHI